MLLWSDDQIAALGRTLLQGRAGQPSLLLVQGEPGAGKSSLLGELVRRAHEFQLLAAEGRESEDSPAAGPVLLHTDDTHSAHPESVEALRLLLARADRARLLIAVGIRPPDGPVARAVAKFDVGSRQELTALVRGGR